ncbi:MAG: ribulose-phosphate 3-epimerase [Planctomycetota bacterium]
MAQDRPDNLIAPSLLSADFARLADELARAEAAGADWHHVDVMDGHFVNNLTIGPPVVASIKRVAGVPLDVHLMITDPWRHAEAFLDAGADVLTFHAETLYAGDPLPLIHAVHARGARVGMAINPETREDVLLPYLDRVDLVLVMSVRPGFGGQSFRADVLDKVRRLREVHGYAGHLEMDGGLARDTVGACAEAGCNVFVAGSALYGAEDMAAEVAELRRIIG